MPSTRAASIEQKSVRSTAPDATQMLTESLPRTMTGKVATAAAVLRQKEFMDYMAIDPAQDDEPRDFATFMKERRAKKEKERLREREVRRTQARRLQQTKPTYVKQQQEFCKWLNAQGGSGTGDASFQTFLRERRADVPDEEHYLQWCDANRRLLDGRDATNASVRRFYVEDVEPMQKKVALRNRRSAAAAKRREQRRAKALREGKISQRERAAGPSKKQLLLASRAQRKLERAAIAQRRREELEEEAKQRWAKQQLLKMERAMAEHCASLQEAARKATAQQEEARKAVVAYRARREAETEQGKARRREADRREAVLLERLRNMEAGCEKARRQRAAEDERDSIIDREQSPLRTSQSQDDSFVLYEEDIPDDDGTYPPCRCSNCGQLQRFFSDEDDCCESAREPPVESDDPSWGFNPGSVWTI